MPQTLDTFKELLSECAFPGLELEVAEDLVGVEGVPEELRCYWLRVVARGDSPFAVCTRTETPMDWNGRKHRLSIHMTDTELVFTAFYAISQALEHEARERFTFKGIAVADSHLDIHALVRFAQDPSHLDSRAPIND